MITYEWRAELTDAEASEVRDLVAEAAAYDDEAGFSRVRPVGSEGGEPPAGSTAYQLVVRYRPVEAEEDATWPLAAYLRVDVDADGVGSTQFVVHPRFRSLGVGTLTFEKLGLPPAADDGWWGTGATVLQAWAYGDHPAADRMARRFGAGRVSRMWKLVKPLRRADPDSGAADVAITVGETDDTHARRLAERDGTIRLVSPRGREHLLAGSRVLLARDEAGATLGACRIAESPGGNGDGSTHPAAGAILTMDLDPDGPLRDVGRTLLRTAVEAIRQAGARQAQVYVDAEAEVIVQLTRELSFEHDRSDVCYRAPHPP